MPRNAKNEDPEGVAEVRRWRAQVTREAGGTIEGLIRLVRRNGSPTRAQAAQTPRQRRTPGREAKPRRSG